MDVRLLLGIALVLAACGDGPGEEAGGPAGDGGPVVEVWFSRGEAPVMRERVVEAGAGDAAESDAAALPAAALRALVRGPTEEERAAGLSSWFSAETADALTGVELRDGFLVVDFRELNRVIPGAGSSAGSAQLLTALDSTVFQFAAVDSVSYRLDGSCAAFWEWLQRGCRVVRRP